MSALTDNAEIKMIEGFNRTGLTAIADWTTTTYAVGDVVQAATWNDRVFRCVVAGVSTGSEPAFSTTIGAAVPGSGSVFWVKCAMEPGKCRFFSGC